MTTRTAISILSAAVVLAVSAAPSKTDPVAEGFPSWEGVNEKNYLQGRVITSSDLRHRVVLMITLKDDANLQKHLVALSKLIQNVDETPAGFSAQWDSIDRFPRKGLVLVTFKDAGKSVDENLKTALKAAKGMKEDDASALASWKNSSSPAFYRGVTLCDAEQETDFPYVRVLDGKTANPVFKGLYKPAEVATIRKKISKCKADLGEWNDPLGVTEVQHFKDVEKKVLEGKPLKPCLEALKRGIKDKNPEKAREAQIMYDAINQYASDLKLRILLEFKSAPARAFADAQKLFKAFPQEKKALASVDLFLKTNKSALTIGKMFEKYLEWSQPNFTFKNASEAKKAVQLVNSWKKPLEKMSQDKDNPVIQGEASLILSQIDSLGEILMTKVPQK